MAAARSGSGTASSARNHASEVTKHGDCWYSHDDTITRTRCRTAAVEEGLQAFERMQRVTPVHVVPAGALSVVRAETADRELLLGTRPEKSRNGMAQMRTALKPRSTSWPNAASRSSNGSPGTGLGVPAEVPQRDGQPFAGGQDGTLGAHGSPGSGSSDDQRSVCSGAPSQTQFVAGGQVLPVAVRRHAVAPPPRHREAAETSRGCPSSRADRYPAANASPAPIRSIAVTGTASTAMDMPPAARATAPRDPRLTTNSGTTAGSASRVDLPRPSAAASTGNSSSPQNRTSISGSSSASRSPAVVTSVSRDRKLTSKETAAPACWPVVRHAGRRRAPMHSARP